MKKILFIAFCLTCSFNSFSEDIGSILNSGHEEAPVAAVIEEDDPAIYKNKKILFSNMDYFSELYKNSSISKDYDSFTLSIVNVLKNDYGLPIKNKINDVEVLSALDCKKGNTSYNYFNSRVISVIKPVFYLPFAKDESERYTERNRIREEIGRLSKLCNDNNIFIEKFTTFLNDFSGEMEKYAAELEKEKIEKEDENKKIIAADDASYERKLKEALEISIKNNENFNPIAIGCNNAWGVTSDITGHLNKMVLQCIDDLKPLFNKRIVQEIKKPSFKAKNCEQYAIKKGKNWIEAPFDMSYSPLAGKSQQPVMFFGKILDGDNSEFLVFNDRTSINSYIAINSQTTIFKQNNIQIKGSVFGYGIKTGSQKVSLLNGAKTTISVITASCIQPL